MSLPLKKSKCVLSVLIVLCLVAVSLGIVLNKVLQSSQNNNLSKKEEGTRDVGTPVKEYIIDDTVSYNWVEISGTGTPLNHGDDWLSAGIDIGFTFNYYDNPYTKVKICSNGWASFDLRYATGDLDGTTPSAPESYTPVPIPSLTPPNNMTAPYWRDLASFADGGNIYYQTFGFAPNRYFVVEWYQVFEISIIDTQTFELIFYETSNDIKFQYQSITGTIQIDYRVGVENGTGTRGEEYINAITPPKALKFSYGIPSGYSWTDSNDPEPKVTYSWIDGVTGGTKVANVTDTDNGLSAAIDIGFTFNFYGVGYTQVKICSNGWMSFDTTTTATLPYSLIPSIIAPNCVVAPFWKDLDPSPTGAGDVYNKTIGTSPNRQFVVTWDGVRIRGTAYDQTFEIVLYETANDIWFQYKIVDNPDATGFGPLIPPAVGVENATGSRGTVYNKTLTSLLAVKFSRGDVLTVTGTSLAPANVLQGTNDVVMEKLELSAGSNTIKVLSIKIDESGTSTLDSDTTSVRLFDDADNDGLIDAGETLLGNGVIAAQTVTITISGGYTITVGTPQHILIVYNVSATATLEVTLRAKLLSETYVTVESPDTVDAFSNIESNAATIKSVDSNPPASTATSDNYNNTGTWKVYYTATDVGWGLDYVELWYRFDSGSWGKYANDTQWNGELSVSGSFSFTALEGQGIYEFYTIAWDLRPNRESAPLVNDTWVKFDNEIPSSQTTYSPAYNNTGFWDVLYTASDSGIAPTGIDYIELWYKYESGIWSKYANNTSWNGEYSSSGSFAFTAADGDGSYYFYTIACDISGNRENSPATYDNKTVLDTVEPIISNLQPPENAIINDNIPTISADYSDTLSGINKSSTRLFVDLLDVTADSTVTYTYVSYTPITPLDEGKHNCTVRVYDNATNSAEKTWNFTVDTIKPASVATSPPYTNQTTWPVTYTAQDSSSGLDYVELWYRYEGGPWTPIDNDTYWDGELNGVDDFIFVATGGDGLYEFYTIAYDIAGNREIAPLTNDTWVLLDTTAPEIVSTSPTGRNIPCNTNIIIIFSESMNHTSVEATITISGVDMTSVTFNWDSDYTVLTMVLGEALEPEMTYTVTINSSAKDIVGNSLEVPSTGYYSWTFETESKEKKGFNYWMYIFIAIVMLVVIILILIFLTRKKTKENKKKALETQQSHGKKEG